MNAKHNPYLLLAIGLTFTSTDAVLAGTIIIDQPGAEYVATGKRTSAKESSYIQQGGALIAGDASTPRTLYKFYLPPALVGSTSLSSLTLEVYGKTKNLGTPPTHVYVGTDRTDYNERIDSNEGWHRVATYAGTAAKDVLSGTDAVGTQLDLALDAGFWCIYDLRQIKLVCTYDDVPDTVLAHFQTAYAASRCIRLYGQANIRDWDPRYVSYDMLRDGLQSVASQLPSIRDFTVTEVILPGLGLSALSVYTFLLNLNNLDSLAEELTHPIDYGAFYVSYGGSQATDVWSACNVAAAELYITS